MRSLNDAQYNVLSFNKNRNSINDFISERDYWIGEGANPDNQLNDMEMKYLEPLYPNMSLNDAKYQYFNTQSDLVDIFQQAGIIASRYDFTRTGNAYQTDAGPTAAAVNDPVGLELDAMGTVGPELVTVTPVFTSLDASFVVSTTGGILTAAPTGTLVGYFPSTGPLFVGGETYQITVTISSYISGAVALLFFGGGTESQQITGTVTFTVRLDAGATGVAYLYTKAAGTTLTIGSISVREVTGNHATQPTAINRPTVQQDGGGRFYASFNGTTSNLALSSVPFQITDDFCVTVCCNGTNTAGYPGIFCLENANALDLLGLTYAAGGKVQIFASLGGVTQTSATAGDSSATSVITMWKVGTTIYLRVNSVAIGNIPTGGIGTNLLTKCTIGAYPTFGLVYLNGAIYDINAIKGTLTLAQVITLEKAAAQRAGLVL